MGKHRFVTNSLLDLKAKAFLVIHDVTLSEDEKRKQLEQIRFDCTSQYRYYSQERKELDTFIMREQKACQTALQSVTRAS